MLIILRDKKKGGEMKLTNSFSLKADITRLKKLKTKGLRIKKAFTLIELLVVIAIIGILAGVVVVNVGSARVKARDAKRISDMKAIQTALEMYYDDNDGSYPNPCSNSWCYQSGGNWSNLGTVLSGYLSSLPVDPSGSISPSPWSGGFTYGYYPLINCSDKYMLVYRLESISMDNSPGVTCGGNTFNYGHANSTLTGYRNTPMTMTVGP